MICNSTFERTIPFDVLLPAIAKYINALPDKPIDTLLQIICQDLFGSESKLDLVKLCYGSYMIKNTPSNTSSLFVTRINADDFLRM